MAVVDDTDAVSRFAAAMAAHRRLNAREDALADAQRAALSRAESHDLAAPPTENDFELPDEVEARVAPPEPPKLPSGGGGGGVYGRAARRNTVEGTSRDEYGDAAALEALGDAATAAVQATSEAAVTAVKVTGDGLQLAATGVVIAAGATAAVVVGAAVGTAAAAGKAVEVSMPVIKDAASATAGYAGDASVYAGDAVEAAGPILRDAADATAEAAGRAVDVAVPVLQDAAAASVEYAGVAADAGMEYAGNAADAAGPVIRSAADATADYASHAAAVAGPALTDAAAAASEAASAAVENLQEVDWGDVDPGCSYHCGILEADNDLLGLRPLVGGAFAPSKVDDSVEETQGPTIDDVAAFVQSSLDDASAAALRATTQPRPTAWLVGGGNLETRARNAPANALRRAAADDDIAFDGDAGADAPEKPKPKRRKSKKKKKAPAEGEAKSPKLRRKGSRRKKAAGAAAAEARAAEQAEQAAEREVMMGRIADLEKYVDDLSTPAPDLPVEEKPVCGCVIE